MKPLPKNHKCIRQLKTLGDLMPVLHTHKSIYFAPAGRVLPTKFFMCWSWGCKQALIKHMEAGSFWEIEKKEDISRVRIRRALEFANRSKMAMFLDKHPAKGSINHVYL